jgi:hypothetical protein
MPGTLGTDMDKSIFTREQENQIRQAYKNINIELGLDKLDDKVDLELLMRIGDKKYSEERLKSAEIKIRTKTNRSLVSIGAILAGLFTVQKIPTLAMGFAAGALVVILNDPYIDGLKDTTPSAEVFRGESEFKNDGSGNRVPMTNRTSTIVIPGDSLSLPGSTPTWVQILQLATEVPGQTTLERTPKELKIWITITPANEKDLLSLRVALGLKPNSYGTVLVIFNVH